MIEQPCWHRIVTVCTTAESESALVASSTSCAAVSVGAGTVFVAGGGLVIIENLAGMTSNEVEGICNRV